MTTSSTKEVALDVPAQVFEKFLKTLADTGASAELVTRLRKVLLEERIFTERVLKAAVLGEESLP